MMTDQEKQSIKHAITAYGGYYDSMGIPNLITDLLKYADEIGYVNGLRKSDPNAKNARGALEYALRSYQTEARDERKPLLDLASVAARVNSTPIV